MKDCGPKGVAKTVNFPLQLLASSDLAAGATFVAGDVLLSKAGGNFAPTTNLPTPIFLADGTTPSGEFKIALTNSEWDNNMVLRIVDQSDPKIWKDQTLRFESYNADDADHAFAPVGAAISFAGPFFRHEVDLDGRTRIVIRVTDAHGPVPTAAEITAGTFSIYRRARGTTTWVSEPIVDAVVPSKADGEIYLDFNAADADVNLGDELYLEIQGVKVTRGGVDYEMDSGASMLQYHFAVQGRPVESLSSAALAQVNVQCDTALADYDAPTKGELDAAVAPLATTSSIATLGAALSVTDSVVDSIFAIVAALDALDSTAVQAAAAAALADYDAPTKDELDTAQSAITSAVSAAQTAILGEISGLENPSAAAIAVAVWAAILEGSLTATEIMQVLLAASAGEVDAPAPGAGGDVAIKSPINPAITRIAGTVDTQGQRTAVQINP